MRALARTLTAVEVHAEGEQGTCYLGSVFDVPGRTMREKLHHLNEVDDSLRRFLCFEPRGRPQASANLVFPSTDPDADAGFVILQADRAHAMSGSNTICVVTALLETGTVPMAEPETAVVARDRRRPRAHRADLPRRPLREGHARRRPSFVEALDVPLTCPGYGNVPVDVAYGGCYYLLVDAAAARPEARPRRRARAVVEAAPAIQQAARDTIRVQHPEMPEIDFISYVMVTGDDEPDGGRLRGATVLTGRIDRSPCGTGNSARLACMAARGQAAVGSRFVARSLIDSEFVVEIIGRPPSAAGRPCCRASAAAAGWSARARPRSTRPTRTRSATCSATSGAKRSAGPDSGIGYLGRRNGFRSGSNAVMSLDVRPVMINSAMATPLGGASVRPNMPCPAPTTTLLHRFGRPMNGKSSGLIGRDPAQCRSADPSRGRGTCAST